MAENTKLYHWSKEQWHKYHADHNYVLERGSFDLFFIVEVGEDDITLLQNGKFSRVSFEIMFLFYITPEGGPLGTVSGAV